MSLKSFNSIRTPVFSLLKQMFSLLQILWEFNEITHAKFWTCLIHSVKMSCIQRMRCSHNFHSNKMHFCREPGHIISAQQVSARMRVCQMHQLSSWLTIPVRCLHILLALWVGPWRQAPSGRNQGVDRCSIYFLVGILQPVVWMTRGQSERETARQSLQAPTEFFCYQNTVSDKPINTPCEFQRKLTAKIDILAEAREWMRGKSGQQVQKYQATF